MQQVTVYPGGMIIHVEDGTAIRDLLIREGLLVDFPCGGRGLCNQCRVRIDPPTESGKKGREPLSEKEVAAGVRLACQAVVEGDCSITIPEEKEVRVVWQDPAKAEGTQLLYGEPMVMRRPSAARCTAPGRSAVRLGAAARGPGGGRDAADHPGLRGGVLRDSAGQRMEGRRLSGRLPADLLLKPSDLPVYGFAVDLGTTTVDVSLHNLETGGQIGRRTMLNQQSAFGADVISRTQAFHDDRDTVRKAALETIAGLCQKGCSRRTV